MISCASRRGVVPSPVDALVSVVARSARDLASLKDERRIHEVLSTRCRAAGLTLRARRVIEGPGLPRLEVDLISQEHRLAVEVKVDSRFYAGLGQAMAARELYGYEAVLIHVVDRVDPPVADALKRLGKRAGIKIILIGRRPLEVKVVP